MICFARKVFSDLNRAEERERLIFVAEESGRRAVEEGLEGNITSPRSGNPFLGNFRPYSPPSGSTDGMPPGYIAQDSTGAPNPFASEAEAEGYAPATGSSDARSKTWEQAAESWEPTLSTFEDSFFVVFATPSNDKSEELLRSIGGLGGWVEYGIILGFLLSTGLAVLLGQMIDWLLTEPRKLFIVCCSMVALCFALLSDAVLLVIHYTFRPQLDSNTLGVSTSPQPTSLHQGLPGEQVFIKSSSTDGAPRQGLMMFLSPDEVTLNEKIRVGLRQARMLAHD
jgi:hypothetical protein